MIGDKETVLAFRLVGAEGKIVYSSEEMYEEILKAMKRKDVALVFISENYATLIRDKVTRLRLERRLPIICEIPSRESRKVKGDETTEYKKVLKEILGVEI